MIALVASDEGTQEHETKMGGRLHYFVFFEWLFYLFKTES